eukprot:gene34743-44931_t
MSDAAAKAKARRAKILARENKQVSAVNVDNDTELEAESQSKTKERPIASRRSYVSSKGGAESSENNEQQSDSQSPAAINDTVENIATDSNKVEEISSTEAAAIAANCSSSIEAKEGGTATESSKVEFTPKAVKEIEKEIAENTAKFDAQTLQKEDNKKKSKGKSAAGKVKVGGSNNIHPASVLKFLRVAVLLIVGIHIGYHSAKFHRLERSVESDQRILTVQSGGVLKTDDLSGEFLPPSSSSSLPVSDADFSSSSSSSSWLGWVQSVLRGQLECALTAVGLVSWVVGAALAPLVNARFAVKANKGSIFATVIEVFTNGFEGVFEYFYGWFGEIALYLFSIIGSTAVFSIVFLQESSGQGVSQITTEL